MEYLGDAKMGYFNISERSGYYTYHMLLHTKTLSADCICVFRVLTINNCFLKEYELLYFCRVNVMFSL
jgi:hypothetical protein